MQLNSLGDGKGDILSMWKLGQILSCPLEYWTKEGQGCISSIAMKALHVDKITVTCQRIIMLV